MKTMIEISTGKRVLELAKSSGIPLTTACNAVDLKYGTLHAQITRGREIPFSTIDKLSRFYNVPHSYFSPFTALLTVAEDGDQTTPSDGSKSLVRSAMEKTIEAGYMPTTETVLDWLEREDGVLRNFGFLNERFDLFKPVNQRSERVRVAELGGKSLATIFFNVRSEDEFYRKLSRFPEATRVGMVDNHFSLRELSRYRVDDVSISVPVDETILTAKYRRIMAPVKTESGSDLTLVYARLIRAHEMKLDVHSAKRETP